MARLKVVKNKEIARRRWPLVERAVASLLYGE